MKQLKGFRPNYGKGTPTRFVGLKEANVGKFKTGYYSTEPGHSGFKKVVRQYRIGATQRGIDFMLSESDVKRLTKSNCYYCNTAPAKAAYCEKQRTRQAFERSKYLYNGIDRVDSNKPYILENCVPCCKICNAAKSNLSIEDFMSYLNNLIVNFGGVPFLP